MSGSFTSLIRDLHRRRGRERRGLTFIEGVRLVEEALASGIEFRGAALSPALEATPRGSALKAAFTAAGIPLVELSDRDLADVADTEHPQGVLAVIKLKHWSLDDVHAEPGRPVLVLDRVQDPGNVGTMVRTAFALGAAGVIALKGTAEFTAPKVLRGSMGALFQLPAVRSDIEAFFGWHRASGAALWLAEVHGEPVSGIKAAGAINIVIGNEGAGLDPALGTVPHRRVAIPLLGPADSLNAAVTAGILLYEVSRGP
ncbi:MAG: RNA methyltransferase [Gemmatimonadales bacterium]|nr:RNA methyltransferase [Gemmatimonadales bacterium]